MTPAHLRHIITARNLGGTEISSCRINNIFVAVLSPLTGLFSTDVVWHVPGDRPISGVHRGRDAAFAALAKTVELRGGSFKIELHDVLANDEHA